jgi:hypothetical protein
MHDPSMSAAMPTLVSSTDRAISPRIPGAGWRPS